VDLVDHDLVSWSWCNSQRIYYQTNFRPEWEKRQ
jgi:hypothetical protein